MALCFNRIGQESAYYWVVAGVFAIGFVVAFAMRDTREHSLIHED